MKNKVALVTGATSGIGKQIAKQLLENDVKVVINYSNDDEKAIKTKEEFEKYENNLLIIKADISNENQVEEMFNKIEEEFGLLDYLVNNAGIDYMGVD